MRRAGLKKPLNEEVSAVISRAPGSAPPHPELSPGRARLRAGEGPGSWPRRMRLSLGSAGAYSPAAPEREAPQTPTPPFPASPFRESDNAPGTHLPEYFSDSLPRRREAPPLTAGSLTSHMGSGGGWMVWGRGKQGWMSAGGWLEYQKYQLQIARKCFRLVINHIFKKRPL